jgi:hypothetical protein
MSFMKKENIVIFLKLSKIYKIKIFLNQICFLIKIIYLNINFMN